MSDASANQPPTTPPAHEPLPPASRSALFIVFFVVFIDLLGFGIVLPLLPLYATDLLKPLFPGEEQADSMLRGAILGILMASFSFMQFLFAPVWGRISDRVGRRPILLMGLGGSVIFYTLFGIASEIGARGSLGLALALMFVSRLGAGVAGATISTAQAVIADTTPPDRRRAHGMALIGAAFGIGFTFGPLLGFASLFVPEMPGAPGFAAALLSLVALVLGLRRLPETRKPGSVPPARRWLDWNGLRTVLRTPTVGLLILTFFLATFAFGGLESTLALINRVLLEGEVTTRTEMTTEALKASSVERQNFLIFAYVGVVLMLVQGFLYRRLVQRVGEVRFMRLGIALMILGLVGGVAVLAARPPQEASSTLVTVSALAAFTLAVMGYAFLTPSLQALISRRSDPERQGEILGVNQSGAALARILGPMVSIMLFFSTASHILPYLCGASLLGVVFLLSLRVPLE